MKKTKPQIRISSAKQRILFSVSLLSSRYGENGILFFSIAYVPEQSGIIQAFDLKELIMQELKMHKSEKISGGIAPAITVGYLALGGIVFTGGTPRG